MISTPRKFLMLVCAGTLAATGLRAGETTDGKAVTTTTTEAAPEYKNWIELGIGGTIVHGDDAQFEQEHRLPANAAYGGIQDLHIEGNVSKDTLFSIDGHAIFDTNDYDIELQLSKAKLGYIKAGFNEFRSWYDGNAAFFPHNDVFLEPPYPEMHIDRGDAWVELGLRVPNWPEITIRYDHQFRWGQKDSTVWGDTNQTGLQSPYNATRKIVPSFRDIDEKRDIVSLEAKHTFGNTDVLLGMRYEHNTNDYSLNFERGAGQLPPVVPPPGQQRKVTQTQNDDVDLWSGHGITETRITDNFWFTTGYSYTTITNDLSGSRITGTHWNEAFGQPVPTLGQRDHSFINLAGTAWTREHLVNANLFWMPCDSLAILSGFRYTHEAVANDSMFLAEEPVPNVPPFTPTNPAHGFHYGPGIPANGARDADYDRYAQRIEMRYTGIRDWLFWLQGEWEEEWGHVNEFQTIDEAEAPLDKETFALGQKYTVGFNWYPMMRLNFSGEYFHRIAHYEDNNIVSAQFPRLFNQDWNIDDFNFRMTFRPKIPACMGTLALVTRYDFVHTDIDGQWEVFSDGELLAEQQTGEIKKHVISESLNWNPLARFYLQANASYVFNQTDTPANDIELVPGGGPTVVNFRNDYWTVDTGAGYLIDDKTDIYLNYYFYCANDYYNNAAVAVPYGMGATEHAISATVTRQVAKNMRLLFRYGYFNYRDETSGGHNNYRGHSLFSTLQVRF